jgi:hypothetical protein
MGAYPMLLKIAARSRQVDWRTTCAFRMDKGCFEIRVSSAWFDLVLDRKVVCFRRNRRTSLDCSVRDPPAALPIRMEESAGRADPLPLPSWPHHAVYIAYYS